MKVAFIENSLFRFILKCKMQNVTLHKNGILIISFVALNPNPNLFISLYIKSTHNASFIQLIVFKWKEKRTL